MWTGLSFALGLGILIGAWAANRGVHPLIAGAAGLFLAAGVALVTNHMGLP